MELPERREVLEKDKHIAISVVRPGRNESVLLAHTDTEFCVGFIRLSEETAAIVYFPEPVNPSGVYESNYLLTNELPDSVAAHILLQLLAGWKGTPVSKEELLRVNPMAAIDSPQIENIDRKPGDLAVQARTSDTLSKIRESGKEISLDLIIKQIPRIEY